MFFKVSEQVVSIYMREMGSHSRVCIALSIFHGITAVFLMLNPYKAVGDAYPDLDESTTIILAETYRAMGAMIFGLALLVGVVPVVCSLLPTSEGKNAISDQRMQDVLLFETVTCVAYTIFNIPDIAIIVYQKLAFDIMGPPVLLAIHHCILTPWAAIVGIRGIQRILHDGGGKRD